MTRRSTTQRRSKTLATGVPQLRLVENIPRFEGLDSFRGRFGITEFQGTRILGSTVSDLLRSYYFGPDHPFKMRLWNRLMIALGWPRLAVKYFGNSHITLDHEDLLQTVVFEHGVYEPEVYESLMSLASENEIFWDVGAHIGTETIRAALESCVTEVRSFEPNPSALKILRLHLDLNNLDVRIHPFALADKPGRLALYEGLSKNSGVARFGTPYSENVSVKTEVDVFTIDQLVYEQSFKAPTLLKIDVENFDENVLRGAEKLLKKNPPKGIAYEKPDPLRQGEDDRGPGKILKKFGYRLRPLPSSEDGVVRNVLAYL